MFSPWVPEPAGTPVGMLVAGTLVDVVGVGLLTGVDGPTVAVASASETSAFTGAAASASERMACIGRARTAPVTSRVCAATFGDLPVLGDSPVLGVPDVPAPL